MKHTKKTVTDPSSPLFDEYDHRMTCVSKKSYPTFWQAEFAAKEFWDKTYIKLNVYQCPYCKYFHLTSRRV